MTAVTVLTAADCRLCDQAKAALERLAPEFDLDVEMVDLDSEQGRLLAERSGRAFPPAILLDGEPFGFGRLSERKLRRELTRRAAGSSR